MYIEKMNNLVLAMDDYNANSDVNLFVDTVYDKNST